MPTTPYIILVLDVETTGLDPETEHLLEVGALFADGRGSPLSLLVLPDRFDSGGLVSLYLEATNPFVFEMHQKSGLLTALASLEDDKPRPARVDARVYSWIKSLVKPDDEGKLPEIRLGGFSVDFDLRWVRRHLPMTATLLSRRVVDFSQIADFCVAAGLPDAKYPNGREGAPEAAHRGLDDARASLDTYQRALAFLSPRLVVGIDFAKHDDQVDATAVSILVNKHHKQAIPPPPPGYPLPPVPPSLIPKQAAFSPVCPDGAKAERTERSRSKIASFSTPVAGVKRRWSLLDPLRPTLATVVDVLMHGNTKYEPNTWQLVEPSNFREALDRHWHDYLTGSPVDENSGLPHLAHVVCNALFLAWFDLRNAKQAEAREKFEKSYAVLEEISDEAFIAADLPDPKQPQTGDIVFYPIPNDAPLGVGIVGEDTTLPGLVDVWIDGKTRVAVGREALVLAWDAPLDLLEAFAGPYPVADRAPRLSERARAVLNEKKLGS